MLRWYPRSILSTSILAWFENRPLMYFMDSLVFLFDDLIWLFSAVLKPPFFVFSFILFASSIKTRDSSEVHFSCDFLCANLFFIWVSSHASLNALKIGLSAWLSSSFSIFSVSILDARNSCAPMFVSSKCWPFFVFFLLTSPSLEAAIVLAAFSICIISS